MKKKAPPLPVEACCLKSWHEGQTATRKLYMHQIKALREKVIALKKELKRIKKIALDHASHL